MAINTSNNKVRIISTTVGLANSSKYTEINSPALVVNTSDGGIFYADGTGSNPFKQLAALPSHTHSYLPLTGGTVTGELHANTFHIKKSNFSLENSGTFWIGVDTADGQLFRTDKGWYNSYRILDSNNYTAFCPSLGHTHSYLPLSGGTLSANTSRLLTVNNSNNTNNECGIGFNMSSVSKGWVGYDTTNGTYLYTYDGPHKLGIKADGTGFIDGNTIIHSGNIGQQSVNYATSSSTTNALNGLGANSESGATRAVSSLMCLDTQQAQSAVPWGTGYNNAILSISRYSTSKYTSQLGFSASDLYVRHFNNEEVNKDKAWDKVLTSSNYTTYCSSLGHTHSSINDSASGAATTFAYSKSGLNYDDYSWLAGWNGYELRAVAKSQFAKASHTHSYVPIKSVTFTPAETAIGPADVLTKLGSNCALGKGTWDYAGNGYISKDTTGSIAIDLAGCSVIQLGGSSAYTQLYITAPASTTGNSKTNEILFYNDHGSNYSPAWTRVLTNRNYSEYCLPTTGATHTSTFTISSGGDLMLKASSSSPNDPGDLAFYNNSGSELARIYYSSSKMLMRYGSSATSYEILTTNTGAAKSHSHAIGDLPTHTFSSTQALGWSSTIGTTKIPTINTIAYWNGAHTGTSSNLQYCDRGRFGTIVTKNEGDYATAGHTHTGLVGDIISFTKSLNVTTSWQDTGISGTDLSTGTYIIQLYANLAGTASIWDETFSGIMTWYAGSTNSTDADEIFLHKAGHASNGQSLFLRTIRQTGSSTLKLQIACTTNFGAAKSLTFKFRKMI